MSSKAAVETNLEKSSTISDVVEKFFNITRSTELDVSQKKEALAKVVRNSSYKLPAIMKEVIASDRTGWKEVAGGITKLTGYSPQGLGITDAETIETLKHFGGDMDHVACQAHWNQLLTQQN